VSDDLHGRPTAAELVEAVREFLERDVMAATEGRVQFHARVAVNALGMVERELALGGGQAERHRDGLAALGVSSEEELAALIRGLDADDPRLDDIARFVRQTVRDKLEVANPKYLGRLS
jgi:Domain of unknown function (DUF6285)